MSERKNSYDISFEQYRTLYDDSERAAGIGRIGLCLGDIAMRFAQTERVPRYTPETRENDAEHSYMLALVSAEVASQYFPQLDTGLVSQFAIVHDLLELETGDVATFNISDDALKAKASAEHDALKRLVSRLPRHTAMLLEVYEEQQVPEARFVRFIDKFMPVIVDILGSGSKVMHEDYETYTLTDLAESEDKMKKRFEKMFPDPEFSVLHIARHSLARKFEDVFEPAPFIEG